MSSKYQSAIDKVREKINSEKTKEEKQREYFRESAEKRKELAKKTPLESDLLKQFADQWKDNSNKDKNANSGGSSFVASTEKEVSEKTDNKNRLEALFEKTKNRIEENDQNIENPDAKNPSFVSDNGVSPFFQSIFDGTRKYGSREISIDGNSDLSEGDSSTRRNTTQTFSDNTIASPSTTKKIYDFVKSGDFEKSVDYVQKKGVFGLNKGIDDFMSGVDAVVAGLLAEFNTYVLGGGRDEKAYSEYVFEKHPGHSYLYQKPLSTWTDEDKDLFVQDVTEYANERNKTVFEQAYSDSMEKSAERNSLRYNYNPDQDDYYDSVKDVGLVKFLGDLNSSTARNTANLMIGGFNPVVSAASTSSGSSSQAYQKAISEGSTIKDAVDYAFANAVINGGGELLLGGVSGIGDGLLDGALKNTIVGLGKTPLAKTILSGAYMAGSEVAEETLQGVADVLAQRDTYNPNARINLKDLAYEGVLAGTSALLLGGSQLPQEYSVYRSDFDVVNNFSKAAAKVQSDADVDTIVKVGNSIVDASNRVISDENSPSQDKSSAKYIKNEVKKVLDFYEFENFKERIILDNKEKDNIVDDIMNQPQSKMNHNLSRLVNKMEDGMEPSENSVNKTVDFIRDKIRTKDNLLKQSLSTTERRTTEIDRLALIEIEKTLRSNRNEIESEVSLISDGKADVDSGEVASTKQGGDLTRVSTNDIISQTDGQKFSLTHTTKKHTKTDESLEVFQINGRLSKEEYTSLKTKMKEIGGYWSKYVNGFIVPKDNVSLVDSFANTQLTEDISNLKKGDNIPDSNIELSKDADEFAVKHQQVIDEYANSVDADFRKYIDNIIDNDAAREKPYPLADVSSETADKIKSIIGVDTEGWSTLIEPRMVQHIWIRHGKNGIHDHSMENRDDIARMQYVMNHADDVKPGGTSSAYKEPHPYLTGKMKSAKTIIYSKKVNGTYYVVEAVPDTSKKTNYVTSAYIQKNKEVSIADDKKMSPRVTSTSQSNAPGDGFDFSDTIVSQNKDTVNTKNTKASEEKMSESIGLPKIAPEVTTNSFGGIDGVATETVSSDSIENTFYNGIADRIVSDYLDAGNTLTVNDLQKIATDMYGGSLAEGTFSVKDMTDALELAVNRHIIKQMSDNTAQYNSDTVESAVNGLAWAENLLKQIPTQTKRTDEQMSLQQFSTPPNIAYLANWVANINETDFMLEPSAGIGGLASFAKGFGAVTAVNEISERRLGALRSLGFDHVFSEDAAQIDNILPDFVKPTVVVMNPPFSSTGGRTKNSTANAKPHVEQALSRLEDGGRLVAILGQGMSNDAPMFAGWWDKLRGEYDIRANIGIDGSNYRKYGTTFNVRLVVIDKTGAQTGKTITGDFKTLDGIPDVLKGVRNDRTHIGGTESDGAGAGDAGASRGAGRVSEGGQPVSGAVHENDADDVASFNAMGRRLSPDSGRGVRSESDILERRQSNTGTTVQSDNGKPGRGVGADRVDEGISEVAPGEPGGRSVLGGQTSGRIVGGRGVDRSDLSSDGRQSGNASVEGMGGGRGGDGGISPSRKPPRAQKKKANTSDDGIYAGYVPSKLAVSGAKPHPAKLVESSAMAAVAAPEITYAPHIPKDVIERGLISDVQLENISYAGQAHEQMLDNGARKGYFIGDGTGVGKGRQAAGIILDNFNQGRRKALWISENKNLIEDAKRDWGDIGGNPNDIFNIDGIRKGVGRGKNKKIPTEGILFVPYTTVRAGKGKNSSVTNAEKIVSWLGEDFDGVIVYDEAHNMNSLVPARGSRGTKKASQKAVESNKIQDALPNARVVYMSATGATEVKDLCFASRLGLWGKGTAFMNAEDFSSKIGASGVAGMELVASSLKSMGVYQARSISFDGVRYDSVRHRLTKTQRQMYDTMSEAWQVTLQNMEKAIRATGMKDAGTARSVFYSAMQNFYNQVLSSMATPSVIEDIRKELDAGHSCVIQLVNTNESQLENELSKAKAEESDLEDLDITPRGALLGFLENSFPVQQFEEYLDEHGNKQTRAVYDSKGNPVLNKQAVADRDALIERINEMSIPDGPIDMILNAFGSDNVAEVTGRSRRVVTKIDEHGNPKRVEENLRSDFRISETTAFQNGEKRILIFSNAGSTGRSYHADNRAKNQQQRIHYILQPGWNAKTATQGFGRTHRSNQAQPPVYKLVTTDIEGQKRFVTSIARRLDQLGALTKGQRQTGSGIFGEKDNLESPLSRDALREFYKRLGTDKIDGVSGRDIFTKLGLARYFYDEYGNFTLKNAASDDIPTFLNRLLALKVNEQNIVFGEFESIRQQMYDAAIENGTLDTGISNVKADKIVVDQEETVHTNPQTGSETKYVKATAFRKTSLIQTVDDAAAMRGQFQGLRRMEDGSVRAVYRVGDETDAVGRVHKMYLLQSPNRSVRSRYNEGTLQTRTTSIPEAEWNAAWAEEIKNVPEFNESVLHVITGDILSVWNKLPQDGNIKAMKIVTSDGDQILGRIIPDDKIEGILRGMNVKSKDASLSGAKVYDAVLKNGREAVFSQSYTGKNTIKKSRVAGENRLELTGSNLWALQSEYPDIFTETIQYQKRWFIPTGDKGRSILNDIVSKYNVTMVNKNESSLFYSRSDGEWGSKGDKTKKIKSVSDLQRKAKELFGVEINTGKVGSAKASGVYNTHANTIRTRVYGDLPTIAHELGHFFDKRYRLVDSPEIDELVALYRDDLESAGYNESVYFNESVAYYFADLLRDKQTAEANAPMFSEWLDGILYESDKKKLSEYIDLCNAYHAEDTINRRRVQVKYRHKENSKASQAKFQVDTFLRNPRAYSGALSKRFVRAWIDDIVDLKLFDKTYDLAMKERAAESVIWGRLHVAFTDNNGNVIGKSLEAHLQEGDINDLNHHDFNAYLIARVALDRIEAAESNDKIATMVYADRELQDKESIIRDLNEFERKNPSFVDAANGVYEYRDCLLQVAVDSGVISEELSNYLKETFPHYVPLFRVQERKDLSSSFGRGKKTPRAPVGRFKGSGRDIYSPIENLMYQTANFTKSIMQNEVRREFADFIDEHEDMGWVAEKIPETSFYDVVSTGEIVRRIDQFESAALKEMDADEKAQFFDDVLSFVGESVGMWKKANDQGKNVISVLRNGRHEYYEIHDQDVMNALLSMKPQQGNVVLETLNYFTKNFKLLTTGYNPQFAATNVPRDIQSGYISSRTTNNPVKYLIDFVVALGESVGNSKGYQSFIANGGGYQGAFTKDMRTLKGGYRRLLGHKKSPVVFLSRMIDSGESASRYAEYKRARKQGIDALEALRAAQEVTVNFQRRGTIGKQVDKAIPYFNSAIQGLYHFYSTLFGDNPKKKSAWVKLIAGNVLASALVLAWHYCKDDEEAEEAYDRLSTYNKNAYWCFYVGDGKFIRIAKPKDLTVFSTLIENFFQQQVRENPAAFYDYGEYLLSVFFPPGLEDVAVFGTALSLARNETFTGSPIVSSAYEKLDEKLQYDEDTSQLAIVLGSALNLSPMQIDFVIDDTTGFVGDFLLNVTKQKGADVDIVLTTDSVYSNNIASIFYDTKERYDTYKASYNATRGADSKYTAYDVYGSYKYGKISDLYSSVNSIINSYDDANESREDRRILNDLIDSVNRHEVTEVDKAVSELSEAIAKEKNSEKIEVSDIAPYIVVPETLKDSEKNSYALGALDMMDYYTESQIVFEALYPQVLEAGYSTEETAAALKELKKEIKSLMDDRWLEILMSRD